MDDEKKIILFGAGRIGRAALRYFGRSRILCFVDNNARLAGEKIYGVPVISFLRLKETYSNYQVVISTDVEPALAIAAQLEDSGIRQYAIFLQILQEKSKEQTAEAVAQNQSQLDLEEKNRVKRIEIASTSATIHQNQKKYLVICNGGYPKEDNYRCMFAHDRVLQYIKAGLNVEVFGFIWNAPLAQYKYDGVDVIQGGAPVLRKLLQKNHYEKLLIHFVDDGMMCAIQDAGKLDMPMIIWCHGYEVQPWYRCWFNHSQEQIERDKVKLDLLDIIKKSNLKKIYSMNNIHFIFVSAWQMGRSKKFVGILPKHCSVIHNHINCEFYASPAKKNDDRLRILSIKNHATRTYANDLTAKAILELSEREFFPKLTFELYGDGKLFEDNFGELIKKNFSNVHIHRNFLRHDEMRDRFRGSGIFLSPTRMDSHQVTTSEAMAAGMSVITSSAGPIREFMDEDCGSIFEFDNYRMMAEEIEYLYFHPDEFLRKSQNAVQRVRTQCSYEQTIGRELQLIIGG